MKRRLILATTELRERIADITSPQSGRRVVVSAFIGADALEFMPNPKGATVYCWDHPSGTDPEGVADLMQDAAVWFVTGLHMKIYWSKRRGVLIGSPNLSNNALGADSRLLESAIYYDDSSAVDIEKVEAVLKKTRRRAEDWIDELRRRANRDPIARRGRHRARRSLEEYFALRNPAPWRISLWSGRADDHRSADYQALVGVQGIGDTAEARERLTHSTPAPWGSTEGDWLLTVVWRQRHKPRGPLAWLNVAHAATVNGKRRAYEVTGRKRPPPFDCTEAGFSAALRRFLVGNVAESADYGITMTPKRLRLLGKELGF
jgi:hypothetical protein